jgi:hypothetical protein
MGVSKKQAAVSLIALCMIFAVGLPAMGMDEKEGPSDGFTRVSREDVLSGWTVVNEGTIDGPPAWFISNGIITQSGNIYGGGDNRDGIEKPGTYALNGDQGWTDYTMSVDLLSRDDDGIGVMFRYKDKDNYYRFSMDQQRGYRRLMKKVDGEATLLAEDDVSYEQNKWYTFRVNLTGDHLEIFIDGQRIFDVTDGSLKAGRIGLYSWGNARSDFRNLLMTLHSGWVVVDEGEVAGPSSWSVKEGMIRQSSPIKSANGERSALDRPGTYVINGNGVWSDCELGVSLRSDDDHGIGVMFRYTDKDNYYLFVMDREMKYRRLIKKAGGKSALLAEDGVSYEKGVWYRLKIQAVGRHIKVSIDNAPLFEVTDDSLKEGKVSLYCWGNQGAAFKELVAVPLGVDEGPVEKATALPAEAEAKDSGSAIASTTTSNEETATKDGASVKEAPGNSVEIVEEAHLGDNYFDTLTSGEVGDAAGDTLPPEAAPVYSEAFMGQKGVKQPLPATFHVVDDGEYDGPSLWSLEDGVLYQKSNMYGGTELQEDPVKPGTYLLSGDMAWKDYVFTGKMLSRDDDAIGVMFRYQNNDRYYRFSMDSQRNYRRLIKKVDGYVITLAEDAFRYEKNKWYAFKVILSGEHIQVFVNGSLVFDVKDNEIPSGKIARYVWGNEGAAFKDFSVAPLEKGIEFVRKKVDIGPKDPVECEDLRKLEKKLKELTEEVDKYRASCRCGR